MSGTLRCRVFGHKWGLAFAEAKWWLCDRCGADQLDHARRREVQPAWDWLEDRAVDKGTDRERQ